MEEQKSMEEEPLLPAERSELGEKESGRWSSSSLCSYQYVGSTCASYVMTTASLARTEVSVEEIQPAAPFSDHYPPSNHAALISSPEPDPNVADVMLWRRKNVTVGILSVTLAAWTVFEKSGYTLLSLVSSVLLLLIVILFLWAQSAAILNRPAPPLPDLHLSEEMVNEVAAFIRTRINAFLSVSQDIALGKDSRMFFKVAAYLLLISVVGSLTDFLTLGYTSLVIVLTIPALYERYEVHIDRFVMMGYRKLHQLYVKLDVECVGKVRKWILEKKKLS